MNSITFLDACQVGENLWFSNYDYNAFMKWNMVSGKAQIIDFFPQAEKERGRLHRRVFHIGEKLYFIPFRGRYIHIWDLKLERWELVEISGEEIQVADAFFTADGLWMFPSYVRWPVIVFHTESCQVESLPHLTEKIGEYIGGYKNWMLLDIACVCQKGQLFYLAEYRRSKIFCIDGSSKELVFVFSNTEREMDGGKIKLQGISVCGEKDFYLTSLEEKAIYVWNPQEGIKERFACDTEVYGKRTPFIRGIDINEKYGLALPCHSNWIFRLNKLTGSVEKIRYPDGFGRCKIYSLFCGYEKNGEEILLYPRCGNGLLTINGCTGGTRYTPLQLNQADNMYFSGFYRNVIRQRLYTGKLNESFGCMDVLEDYLDEVAGLEEKEKNKKAEPIGKRIYEYCKEMCLQEKQKTQ